MWPPSLTTEAGAIEAVSSCPSEVPVIHSVTILRSLFVFSFLKMRFEKWKFQGTTFVEAHEVVKGMSKKGYLGSGPTL